MLGIATAAPPRPPRAPVAGPPGGWPAAPPVGVVCAGGCCVCPCCMMNLLILSPCLLHIGCQGIQSPGLAVGPAPHAVGFLVVHKRAFGGIPGHPAAQLARDVRAMGGDVGVTGGLGVG